MKTVSIVIPAYNAETTLDRCIGSVLNQTYQDFEIILVDDGSTDGTAQKAAAFAAADGRIRTFTIPHGGVSGARNAGWRRATGEYLQFLDADDDLDPAFLEIMVGMLERENADMAICRFNHPFFKTYVTDRVFDLSKREELLEIYQDTYGVVMPWNRVWRRSCFTEEFDENVHFSEDELGNLANLPNVKKIVTTGKTLYHYFFAKKEDNQKEESCVNNIINSEAFWNNKTSFYYMGARLLPKRRAIIEKGIREGKLAARTADDMAYLRLIDYCFWQMPPFIGMGIPEEGLAIECLHIFREPDFIAGYRAQEEYGFALLPLDEEEIAARTKKFTRLCYTAFAENAADDNFKIAYAFIELFLSLFMKKTGQLNPVNYNARMLLELEQNSTPEAAYVNALLAR